MFARLGAFLFPFAHRGAVELVCGPAHGNLPQGSQIFRSKEILQCPLCLLCTVDLPLSQTFL